MVRSAVMCNLEVGVQLITKPAWLEMEECGGMLTNELMWRPLVGATGKTNI